ncbi:hypothetical protein EOT10_33380 [Streptomyces antnestii]|uniref:Nucleotide exchange factor GrpE n=1 Tax=Streptomyces antnestii TaxID=2494256 RepID=A0A437P6V8_9ACTN|nr:hypothetical protein [Streptomyces sp. San01]RVU17989.1 hypothetical protein EOT10_33380 [Streptomyces sp. San01]
MSSSAEPSPATGLPTWDDFAERPVPEVHGATTAPEAELAGVLQRRHEDLAVARGASAAAATRVHATLFELAALVGTLEQQVTRSEEPLAAVGEQLRHRELRNVKDRMLDLLRGAGVEVRDPLGLPADDVLDWADPVHWRQSPDFDAEVVAETNECAVFHEGAVVRFAQVVMGAPAQNPVSENAEDPADA